MLGRSSLYFAPARRHRVCEVDNAQVGLLIRFDPTPGESDDAMIEQPNSIKDFCRQALEGYVLEGRELTGENSIYAPATAKTKTCTRTWRSNGNR